MSIYTHNEYQSEDLDFVTAASHKELRAVIEPLGFDASRNPRQFEHPITHWLIEFPPSPLGFGELVVDARRIPVLQTAHGPIRIIAPTLSVLDRLVACWHHNDAQCWDQAAMVARSQAVEPHSSPEEEERVRLEAAQDSFRRGLHEINARLAHYAKDIKAQKSYMWDSRAEMDHLEKIAARQSIEQSVTSGEFLLRICGTCRGQPLCGGGHPARPADHPRHLQGMHRSATLRQTYKAFYDWLGKPELFQTVKGKLEYADVLPLAYLKMRLDGMETPYREIKHLLIDEMQDYAPVQYAVLARLFSCRKTVLGDVAQSVNPYSASRIEDVRRALFGASLVKLTRSYRSTLQVMEFALQISPDPDLVPMQRHGPAPRGIRCRTRAAELDVLLEQIADFHAAGNPKETQPC